MALHTPYELRELLAEILEGVAGETRDHWREAIGEVEKLPIVIHVRSNWAVHPTGTKREREIIARAAEIVRAEHPYVSG